ncbi:hypothetical protein DFR29_1211 [Tahibacter aquaticus]|uniref:Uncharacterized protein n=1 Tax=Tahibacter aquaticus TaxID=520092 RepID=A0A4R6YM66_9GAMM|nr:hypothetical protein [Tahibacter aquaticus]TDR38329.1 hypothetical protein DFR29_1211 [Tahibacter aquaticus]
MGIRVAGLGWVLWLLTTNAAIAQDHHHYEYYVDVQNGLGETVGVSCNGKPVVRVRPSEMRSINVHGGESLRVRCVAFDHHDQPLQRQAFALDHHDNRADWPIGQGDHDDDHGRDEQR